MSPSSDDSVSTPAPAPSLAGVERERDVAAASRDRFAYLAEASRCLANSLDYETTLVTAAGLALPYLGAWCIVDVCADDGTIRRIAVLHPDPARQAIARELHERYPPRVDDAIGAAHVIRTRRPELVSATDDAALVATARDGEHLRLLRALGLGAWVTAPMVARGRVLGAMTFITTENGRRFGDLDVALAEDIAARAAMALDNATLHGEALRARAAADDAKREAEVARAAAEATSRAKGESLAVMSHELRTPLNAIGGYVQLIEQGLHGPVTPAQREALGRVGVAQGRLLSLVNAILELARLESGRVEYDVRPVDVVAVVREVVPLVEPQCAAKGLELAVELPSSPCLALADREKLGQVLVNLLSNAIKFTPPLRPDGRRGHVAVGLAERAADDAGDDAGDAGAATQLFVRVEDNGIGIAAERQATIFEPFVQAHTAAETRAVVAGEGTGLGLAISRDLARGMGGELRLRSRPDEGTCFTLALRRAPRPAD